MAEAEDVFHAKISASDDTSATIAQIKQRVHALGEEFHHTGEQSEHLHHPHMWEGLTEHINILHEHVGGLSASFGELGGTMTELLPAFAAFGAASSLVGLFETVEHVSEAQAELAHTAAIIGVSSAQLQQFNFVAKMTDTNVEAMHTGLEKLNKVIAESAAGKNKDAAALFAHLGISLRDSNGHMRSAADLLPQVADAIQHTGSAAMRARMAMALMGRGGQEMIPLLTGGGKKIKELEEDSKRLNFTPDDSQRENLLKYADAMKELHASVQAFTDNLGADLAPVLLPIVNHATEWVNAHRAGIANFVAGRLSIIGQWAEAGGIERVEAGVERITDDIDDVVQAFGGWGRAAEVLAGIMVVKGALFLFEPIKEIGELSVAIGKLIIKLGTELVGAWLHVGDAAVAAGAKEEAAAAIGVAGAHGAPAAASAGGAIAAAAERRGAPIDTSRLQAGGFMLGLNLAAIGGTVAGKPIDVDSQDMVANIPGLRSLLTQAQIDKLPQHGAHASDEELPWSGLGARIWNHLPSFPRSQGDGAEDLGLPFAPDAGPRGPTTLPEIDHGGGSRVPDGHIQVDVNLLNAPPGTTATATSTGRGLGGPRVNVGHAWGGADLLEPAF